MNSSSPDDLDEHSQVRSLLLNFERVFLQRLGNVFYYTDATFAEFLEAWSEVTADEDFYNHERYSQAYHPILPEYDDFYSYMLANARLQYNMHVFGNHPPYLDKLMEYHTYTKNVLCLIGIVINIINLVTFKRMGLKDGFVIILFNMSLADLGFNLIKLLVNLPLIFFYIPSLPHSVRSGQFQSSMDNCLLPGIMSMIIVNALMTTLLAFQRCICVLLPLKFKIIFTFRNTVITISFLWVFLIVNYLPVFLYIRVSRVFGFWGELKYAVVVLQGYDLQFDKLESSLKVVNTVIINWVCQVIVLCCVGIMAVVIVKSVRFRQKASRSSSLVTRITKPASSVEEKGDSKLVKLASKKGLSGSKEIRVIMQVVLVSFIFILAHLHYFVTLVIERTIKDYRRFPKYHAFDNVYQEVKEDFYLLNSIVNIFIYLKFNSRFRQVFFRRGNR